MIQAAMASSYGQATPARSSSDHRRTLAFLPATGIHNFYMATR